MRVVLCDDQQMFIEALATVLAARGWTVCALAFTPKEAEKAILFHKPALALVDVGFPEGDGLGLIRTVTESVPETRVIVVTGAVDRKLIADSIHAGAGGFVSKTQDIDRVISMMERVASGEAVINSSLVRTATQAYGRSERELIDGTLTEREQEVLKALVRGQSTGALAAELGISFNTARTHIQNILQKLGVHSRLEAAAFAVRAGRVESQQR